MMRYPRVRGLCAIALLSLVALSAIHEVAGQENVTDAPIVPPVAEPTEAPVPAPVVEPTEPPEPDPTEAPVVEPTEPPVPDPTEAPVVAPTDPPVADPTEAPVATPTDAPVPGPTDAPVPGPTDAPVPGPTDPPVSDPTEAPVPDPTAAPTDAPTRAPIVGTAAPTKVQPTNVPTLSPTAAPTGPPSLNPTFMPVEGPFTSRPSPAPISEAPTATPTTAPSGAPTSADTTRSPTVTLGPARDLAFRGMLQRLDGISQVLNSRAASAYEFEYETYMQEYYANTPKPAVDIEMLKVTYRDSQVISTRLRRGLMRVLGVDRGLQTTAQTSVQFDIEATIRSEDGFTDVMFVNNPFNSARKRDVFADQLRANEQSGGFYDDLETVGQLNFPPPPDDGDQQGDNTTTIIIAVCASVGGLAVLGGGYWYYRKRQADKEKGEYASSVGGDGEGKPPSQLQLSTLGGPDEVSTLAEPTPRMGVIQGGESLAGYGDQSVATVDYDYSKAYGGGGDSIVSETGGTLGSGTRGGTAAGESAAAGPPAAGASQSVFSDSSFSQLGSSGVKEELIDIYAPPGKLGVVIDTPDDGPPVVHAIKDSSVIADQLKVGDKLVSVDDDDVRSMTAIKVSKIISRKSANPTRKLSVIRTSVG